MKPDNLNCLARPAKQTTVYRILKHTYEVINYVCLSVSQIDFSQYATREFLKYVGHISRRQQDNFDKFPSRSPSQWSNQVTAYTGLPITNFGLCEAEDRTQMVENCPQV